MMQTMGLRVVRLVDDMDLTETHLNFAMRSMELQIVNEEHSNWKEQNVREELWAAFATGNRRCRGSQHRFADLSATAVITVVQDQEFG